MEAPTSGVEPAGIVVVEDQQIVALEAKDRGIDLHGLQ